MTTSSGAVFSYTQLFTGPRGELRWLTTKLADGKPTWEYDAAVVKVTPGLSFTTASATSSSRISSASARWTAFRTRSS